MLVDLVQVTTQDGLRLHGALETPAAALDAADHGAAPRQPPVVDAWLCIHGTGSNFYAASTLAGLAPKLLADGAAVLRANTRGHDIICTGPTSQGRWLQGAAFERVEQAPMDLAAWIDFLRERGFARIGILGHSLGAVKAILTLSAPDSPGVEALVAVSPPRLSHAHFCASARGDEFRRTFARAEELVAAGCGDELMLVRVPLPYYVCAQGYVDRYGPEERYNVLRLLARVACPTLVTYGTAEVQADMAFRGMPEAVEQLVPAARRLQVAVIAGADHLYTGCHDVLSGRIAAWLRRVSAAAGGLG